MMNPTLEQNRTKGRRRIPYWQRKPTAKQRRKLSICPHCKRRFYYWQYASKHAHTVGHYGDYNP